VTSVTGRDVTAVTNALAERDGRDNTRGVSRCHGGSVTQRCAACSAARPLELLLEVTEVARPWVRFYVCRPLVTFGVCFRAKVMHVGIHTIRDPSPAPDAARAAA
jgi:hypothetical protein